MTYKMLITLALVLAAAALVGGGCAGDDDGDRQLAQSSPKMHERPDTGPAERSDQVKPKRAEGKSAPSAKSTPERLSRKQQRESLSANEKLTKKLGVEPEPPPAQRCTHIQGNPRLTRLFKADGVCNQPPAPEPNQALPSWVSGRR
jgi:hypothetical protein